MPCHHALCCFLSCLCVYFSPSSSPHRLEITAGVIATISQDILCNCLSRCICVRIDLPQCILGGEGGGDPAQAPSIKRLFRSRSHTDSFSSTTDLQWLDIMLGSVAASFASRGTYTLGQATPQSQAMSSPISWKCPSQTNGRIVPTPAGGIVPRASPSYFTIEQIAPLPLRKFSLL